jgi:molecular chaperone HscB
MSQSYFDLLGVEPRYHLDAADLERRFHERSRKHHPDRHVKSDPETRVRSALHTAQLNQAYRTLREPVQRAEYLLRLHGIEISDERSGHKVDPAFLMEILELREQLAEARAESDPVRVRALGEAVRTRREQALADAEAGFSRFESGEREALGAVADALVAERYFRRFLDEVEAFDEARQAQRESTD